MQAQPIPKPPVPVEHALIEACVSDGLRSGASSYGRAFPGHLNGGDAIAWLGTDLDLSGDPRDVGLAARESESPDTA
jgi:hypothetical protein